MRQERTATNHRTNCLLAALEPEDFAYLEPHLEDVILPKGTILYETDETIRYIYFPHDIIVSLVDVMEDGSSAEMTVFGCEAVIGLISAVVTRESVGRYIVQVPGIAFRITTDTMHEAISTPEASTPDPSLHRSPDRPACSHCGVQCGSQRRDAMLPLDSEQPRPT
jgi:hypothetical protein